MFSFNPVMILETLAICALVLLFKELFGWKSRLIPGVPTASGYSPITGNFIPLFKVLEEGLHDYINENMRANDFTYFHVIGPGVSILCTCISEHVDHMFSKDHFSEWIKGEKFQENFAETLGHGIFVVDGNDWAEKRKVSSYLFSSNSLRNRMSGVFLTHIHHVLENLTAVKPGEIVDLQDLFARFTFDSICTIAFGIDVNSLGGNEEDIQFQRCYDVAQMTNFARFNDPFWKVKKFFKYGQEGQLRHQIEVLDHYIYKIIDRRVEELKNSVDHGDMLSLYIKHGQKKGKEFDSRYLRDMVLNLIIAGRDSTASASMWLIYEISRHPNAEATLLKEIEKFIGDEIPTYDTVSKMPYLRSVFYESLRLHPPVPVEGKFAACDTYLEPGHLFIKKGTAVQFNIQMMNRDPKRYENPEEFIPERWLSDEGEFLEKAEKEFPTFNVKPRSCLGKRMAEFEAGLLITVLLPKLKFRVMDGFIPRSQTGATLFNKNGMKVHVEKRDFFKTP